jgi:hypothetical protein
MSDHQPASNPEPGRDADRAPAESGCEASQGAPTDLHELDFSRLRMARASLDGAFSEC